nr:TadE/TadG family type IV pilus assembly protein [Coprococcus comes]
MPARSTPARTRRSQPPFSLIASYHTTKVFVPRIENPAIKEEQGVKGIFKKPESESGAAIIEFALGVPFLLIFAMAAMEFGQISAASTAVDNAAHAAARELAVNPSGDASSAKEAAVNAASSFFAENMKIETDVSDAEREAYTHRIPDSNGSSYTDRESNVSTRKCTATVSVTIQPQTVLGDAIYAAGGFGGGMTIESNAVELKDATVEGGASSW